MGNQSQDEVFLAAQEAVGAHRDSQGFFLFDNKEYACRNCWKTYAKKSTMARHMKYECGKLPMFGCSKCPYRGYQKTHVERHLSRKHNILLKSDIIRAIVIFGKK
jgi:hypothetical protein